MRFRVFCISLEKQHWNGMYICTSAIAGIKKLQEGVKEQFQRIGTSVHSVEDAKEAERLGVSYMTAGHIYITDCKKGLAPRGLGFLKMSAVL